MKKKPSFVDAQLTESEVLSRVRVPPFCVQTNMHNPGEPLGDGGSYGDALYDSSVHGDRRAIAERLRALAEVIEHTRSNPVVSGAEIVVLFRYSTEGAVRS